MANIAETKLRGNTYPPRYGRSCPAARKAEATDRVPADTLRAAWGELLTPHPWAWFVTLTFPDFPHPERAFKQYRVWVCKLNRHLYGSHFNRDPRKGTVWICGVEYQKRGSIHFHALVYAPGRHHEFGTLRRTEWAACWQDITGGFAMIVEPNIQEAVALYCTKYAVKGGEIEFSPTFEIRHPEAVEYHRDRTEY